MPITKKEAREKRTILTDALIAEAEYLAQLDPFTTASVWQEHIGVMVSAAKKLAEVETDLRRTNPPPHGGIIQ